MNPNPASLGVRVGLFLAVFFTFSPLAPLYVNCAFSKENPIPHTKSKEGSQSKSDHGVPQRWSLALIGFSEVFPSDFGYVDGTIVVSDQSQKPSKVFVWFIRKVQKKFDIRKQKSMKLLCRLSYLDQANEQMGKEIGYLETIKARMTEEAKASWSEEDEASRLESLSKRKKNQKNYHQERMAVIRNLRGVLGARGEEFLEYLPIARKKRMAFLMGKIESLE